MDQQHLYQEWQKLCVEHDAARESYFQAFTVVSQKFSAVGSGKSNDNPSTDQLFKFEETWKAWDDVIKRMDKYARGNA